MFYLATTHEGKINPINYFSDDLGEIYDLLRVNSFSQVKYIVEINEDDKIIYTVTKKTFMEDYPEETMQDLSDYKKYSNLKTYA